MKIDTTKIEGYENLSAEDKVKALEGYEYEVPKSEDESGLKKLLSDRNSEIKKLKDEIRSKMDASEREKLEKEEELERLKQTVAEFEKANKITSLKASYLAIGYNEELAQKRATFMADGDFVNATAVEKEFLTWHDRELKAEKIRSTPSPASSGSGSFEKAVTLDEFRKMDIPQMKALKAEHPEIYEELRNKI